LDEEMERIYQGLRVRDVALTEKDAVGEE